MQYDSSGIAEVVSAIAAWIALALSLLNLFLSRKALRFTEQQEERRKPRLIPYLQDGYVRYEADDRVYAFLLSVSNPTDSDNAVAELDLCLTYTTMSNIQMTIKVPSQIKFGKVFKNTAGPPLAVPARVDAHQTIAGWAFFRVEEGLLRSCKVEGHTIALIDSHGTESKVEPVMIREYGDAS